MAAASQPGPEKFSFIEGDESSEHLVNTSVDYTDNHVNKTLHPAFGAPKTRYNDEVDKFVPKSDDLIDEDALFRSQQAFAEALAQYEKEADTKFKTGIDLKSTHTWEEVLKQVEVARDKYKGVGKSGILTTLRSHLRNFHTAAPAIELWLKLLPSTTFYGSILCGGITIILEAAIRLGKLREDVYLAIDEIPLRIERAGVFMRTYRDDKMKKQAAELYRAIIDALQHMLGWFKRKAGIKYFSSFYKGPAYARVLRDKMKNVENAAQAMDDHADVNQHMRLQDIRQVTWHTRSQLNNIERTAEELKVLSLEARNHIYAIFRDTEAWQEVVKFWAQTRQAHESRTSSPQESKIAVRALLLQSLGHDEHQLLLDVENSLRQIFLQHLNDQDRAIAVIQSPEVEKWLAEPEYGALLVNGNSREHEPISPISTACAMIIHLFTNTVTRNRMPIITTYWFCGLHINGPYDNASGLMRSLVCQLLKANHFEHSFKQKKDFDGHDLDDLLEMFTTLLLQLPDEAAVVCILDGISYYEDSHLRDDTCRVIRRLVRLSRGEAPIFKLLLTSPKRMTHLHMDSAIEKHAVIIDIPQHVNGAKQGINHGAMVMSAEKKVRKLSKSMPAVKSADKAA